jgi:hypothetical protein
MTVTGFQLTKILERSDVTTVIMAGAVLTASADNNVVVPSGKTLAVIGDLDLGSAVYTINAYKGILDLKSGKLTNATGDILMLNADDKKFAVDNSKITGTPNYVAVITSISPTGIDTTSESVMIEKLAIGGTGPNAVPAARLEQYMNGQVLYINEDLTTNVANPFLGTKVTVYGETTAAADITLTGNTDLRGGLKAGAAGITVSGLENLSTGTLNTDIYAVNVDPTSLGNTLTLVALNSAGPGIGSLVLTEDITNVTITSGTGNIVYGNAAVTLTNARFGNTGGIAFTENATITDATGSFAGPVVFEGDASVTGAVITFADTVSFEGTASVVAATFTGAAEFTGAVTATGAVSFSSTADFGAAANFGGVTSFTGAASFDDTLTTSTGAVTFSSTASFAGLVTTGGVVNFNGITTFTDNLAIGLAGVIFNANAFFADDSQISGDFIFTIAEDASLGVIVGDSKVALLTADGGNATITPSSSGVLAFTDDSKITQSAGAILIGGDVLLAAGASYEVFGAVALAINAASSLTLGTGAEFILNNDDGSSVAALKGEGSLIAGGTTIKGGDNGWTAVDSSSSGGTITIAPDAITASIAGMVLTAGTTSANQPSITVAGAVPLSIGAKISLAANAAAKVALTGSNTAPGSLLLLGHATVKGNLILDATIGSAVTIGGDATADDFLLTASTAVADTNVKVTLGDTTKVLPASGIVVFAANSTATPGVVLYNIGGGGPGVNVLITGPADTYTSEIIGGWKVSVTDQTTL